MSERAATARIRPVAQLLPRRQRGAVDGIPLAVTARSDWRTFLVSTRAMPEDVLATVQAATGRDASRRGALPLAALGYDRGRDVLEIVLRGSGNGSRVRCFVARPRWLRVLPPAPGGLPASLAIEDASGESTVVRLYPAPPRDGERR
jgi:hypothetical protein